MSVPTTRQGSDCGLPWCTTPHGTTVHSDDEDHRSVGIVVPVRVRDGRGIVDTLVEVGLLRRRDETRTWFVIEDGDRVHLELTLDSARELRDAIRADPFLAAALDGP